MVFDKVVEVVLRLSVLDEPTHGQDDAHGFLVCSRRNRSEWKEGFYPLRLGVALPHLPSRHLGQNAVVSVLCTPLTHYRNALSGKVRVIWFLPFSWAGRTGLGGEKTSSPMRFSA